MALIPLTDEDLQILAEIEEFLGMATPEVLKRAIHGTLQYYRIHGTVLFLTQSTHTCHGCRFLEMHQARQDEDTAATGTAGNVIPFRRSDSPA